VVALVKLPSRVAVASGKSVPAGFRAAKKNGAQSCSLTLNWRRRPAERRMGRRSPPVPSRWTRADGAQPILRSSRPFELRPAERRGLLRLLPGTKRRAEALNGALSAGLHKRELRPRKVLSAQLGAAAAAAARQSPPPDDGYASQSEGDGACGCGDPSRSMRPRRVSSEDPGALVIEPTGPHTHTVVLLHGMYTAPEDSDTMMELPQSVARVGLPGCKYVFPRAPRRTISWPTGPEASGPRPTPRAAPALPHLRPPCAPSSPDSEPRRFPALFNDLAPPLWTLCLRRTSPPGTTITPAATASTSTTSSTRRRPPPAARPPAPSCPRFAPTLEVDASRTRSECVSLPPAAAG